MAHRTSCPVCRCVIQVPDALIGRAVRCPTCNATFQADLDNDGLSLTPFASQSQPSERQPEALPEVQAEGPRPPAPPRRYPRRDVEPHRGTMILVLGILSFFVCPLVLGIIAWVLGNSDLKKIRAGQMDPAGEANTNAGRICGMIATILGILHFVFIVVVIVIAILTDRSAPRRPAPAPAPVPTRPPRPAFPGRPQVGEPFDKTLQPTYLHIETRPWPGR